MPSHKRGTAVREKILHTADELFYREGIRAIGVDTVVEISGVAKTSLYRWFPTKDDLIAAFLEHRNSLFWAEWDKASLKHRGNPKAELLAHLRWITKYISGPDFRACPFLMAATEFPHADHPSRAVCVANKQEMRRRVLALVREIKVADPLMVADQIVMLIDGAFANSQIFTEAGPVRYLVRAGEQLLAHKG